MGGGALVALANHGADPISVAMRRVMEGILGLDDLSGMVEGGVVCSLTRSAAQPQCTCCDCGIALPLSICAAQRCC
jgi:hypothetical protein